MQFDWDPGKQRYLIECREIDFEDMVQIFDGRPRLTIPSPRDNEARQLSIARIAEKCFAVVWMWRGDSIWLITARRARKNEERWFYQLLAEGGEDGRKN